jgi:hypothetical protein
VKGRKRIALGTCLLEYSMRWTHSRGEIDLIDANAQTRLHTQTHRHTQTSNLLGQPSDLAPVETVLEVVRSANSAVGRVVDRETVDRQLVRAFRVVGLVLK